MTEISHTRESLHPGIPCLVGSRAISSVFFCFLLFSSVFFCFLLFNRG
jgi:hypothetical protein